MGKLVVHKEKYIQAKAAKVGESCRCAGCGTQFTKESYQQAFCKTKAGTKCKDKYWNTVTPEKRNNQTRISPANAAWQARNLNSLYNTHSRIYGYSQAELDREDRMKSYLEADSHHHADVYVGRCEFCECLDCRCDF